MPEGMGRQFFVIGEQGSVAVDNIADAVPGERAAAAI